MILLMKIKYSFAFAGVLAFAVRIIMYNILDDLAFWLVQFVNNIVVLILFVLAQCFYEFM
jgi:hypothetical protein